MGWFSKKKDTKGNAEIDRYSGKPLLILLENYVLDCIGHFPLEKRPNMVAVVNRVFGGGDDWKATLRASLRLDESLDDHVRQMWLRNQEIAGHAGKSLTPEEFARLVVDENFSSLIG